MSAVTDNLILGKNKIHVQILLMRNLIMFVNKIHIFLFGTGNCAFFQICCFKCILVIQLRILNYFSLKNSCINRKESYKEYIVKAGTFVQNKQILGLCYMSVWVLLIKLMRFACHNHVWVGFQFYKKKGISYLKVVVDSKWFIPWYNNFYQIDRDFTIFFHYQLLIKLNLNFIAIFIQLIL